MCELGQLSSETRIVIGKLRIIRIMTAVLHPLLEKDLQSPIYAAHWLRTAVKCAAIFKGSLLFSLAQLHI